jgi:hypothetical protein
MKITQLNGVSFSLGMKKIPVITFSGVEVGFQYSVSTLRDASEVHVVELDVSCVFRVEGILVTANTQKYKFQLA